MSPRGKTQNEQMRAEALAKITEAALKVFVDFGYHGATMKQITKAAGLSYGLVYHYFPSKAKLFFSLVDFALHSSLSGLTQALKIPGTAWEKIESLSAMLVKNALTDESSLYFFIIHQAMTQGRCIPGIPARMAEGIDAYYQNLAPIIKEAQKDGDVVQGDCIVLSAAYLSFVQGLVTLVYQQNDLEKKITPDMLSNILRKGNMK